MSEMSPPDLIERGDHRFKKGDFQGAMTDWQEAVVLASSQGNWSEEAKARSRLANAPLHMVDEMRMSRNTIFVSSCMDELANERKGVLLALKRIGLETFVFEQEGRAEPYPPRNIWTTELAQSMACIGIFWKKYGKYSVEECKYAISRGLPCFIYVTERNALAGKNFQRDPELQTFLDSLNGNNVVVVIGKFQDAFDLADQVVSDILRWLVKSGQQARRALVLMESDRDVASQEIAVLNAKIADLNEELARSASSAQDQQDLKEQITTLKSQIQTLQEHLEASQKAEVELITFISEREEQIKQAQATVTTDRSGQEPMTKETTAKQIKHVLERRLSARVTLLTTDQYVDVIAQIESPTETSHKQLLRVIDAPFTLTQLQAIQEKVVDLSAEKGLLVVTGGRLHEPLFNLYKGDRVSAFLMDPIAPGFEEQLLSNTEIFEAYTFIQLGDAQYALGNFTGAFKWYQAAVSSASAREYYEPELVAWLRIANVCCWVPNARQALESATTALAKARSFKSMYYEARAILHFIEAVAVLNLRDRWQEMYPILLEGVENAYRQQDDLLRASYLICLGECTVKLDKLNMAYDYLQDALNALSLKGRQQRCDLHYRIYQTLSVLWLKKRNQDMAMVYAGIAVNAAQEDYRPYFVASGFLVKARVEKARGHIVEAIKLVEDVLQQSREMGWGGMELEANVCLVSWNKDSDVHKAEELL